MKDEDNPIPNDSHMDELFEYRGVVCQLVYRYPWYAGALDKVWGVVIYWPHGKPLPLARIHDDPEQAIAVAEMRIREELNEQGTFVPASVTTTV